MNASVSTVAHVGFTGSADDLSRLSRVSGWLHEFDAGAAQAFADMRHDHIDLVQGRDFLAEQTRYEMVVLHFVYRGEEYHSRFNPADLPELRVSSLASWSAWRTRLMASGAAYIFAFGSMTEVGGSYIVNLNGYEAIQLTHEFWIFKHNK